MRELSIKELRFYRTAGRAVRRALETAAALVKPGARLVDICEEAERAVLRAGAKPAFPCNIGINEIAAHFSPIHSDGDAVPPAALVKIDVGAHVNGYIADAAMTIALSSKHKKLVHAAREALEVAVSAMKPGVSISVIGTLIERAIAKWHAKPISNLSGHLIGRYSLHAGKSLPNVSCATRERLRSGEVYAIEPFVTTLNGGGSVIESNKIRIFRLVKVREPRDPELSDLFRMIRDRFFVLPFSPRWLHDYGKEEEILRKISRLRKLGYIASYPVLRDRLSGPVAQWEATASIGEETEVIT